MSATAARLTSDLLDGQGMLTAELTMVLAARLSTAVQGDIPSTMCDLMMLIAAAHRYGMRSKRADMRQLLNQAVERRSCSPPRMVMVPRGSQSSLMR